MSIYTILLRFGDRTALLLTILKTTSITQRKWYWTVNCMECRNCVMTNHESRQTLTSGSLSFTVESTWVAYAQRNYQVVFRKGLRTKRFRNLQRHNRRTNSREHFAKWNRSSSCDRIIPKCIFSVSAVNIATSKFITTTDLGFALIHFSASDLTCCNEGYFTWVNMCQSTYTADAIGCPMKKLCTQSITSASVLFLENCKHSFHTN